MAKPNQGKQRKLYFDQLIKDYGEDPLSSVAIDPKTLTRNIIPVFRDISHGNLDISQTKYLNIFAHYKFIETAIEVTRIKMNEAYYICAGLQALINNNGRNAEVDELYNRYKNRVNLYSYLFNSLNAFVEEARTGNPSCVNKLLTMSNILMKNYEWKKELY